MSAATFLTEGTLTKVENNILTISFAKNYSLNKESLDRKENKAVIEQAISQILNTNLRVNLVLSKEAAVPKETQADNPLIKTVLQAFGARVIKE